MQRALNLIKKETLRKPHWITRFLKNGYTPEEIASTLEMEVDNIKDIQKSITTTKQLKAYSGSTNNTYGNVCSYCGAIIPLHAGIYCSCCGEEMEKC